MTGPGWEGADVTAATAPFAGRRVLITGGAGFVGSHLADALVPVAEVRVLDDLSNGRRSNVPDGATLFLGSVADEQLLKVAMADADQVFHLAAHVSVSESMRWPLSHHESNATGTVRVLEAARRKSTGVVVASSAAIYGHPSHTPIDEAHPVCPTSPYGVSKLAADHYAQTYARAYGLDTVALRYFNVFGPRQEPAGDGGVVATFIDRARRGEPIVVEGDGEQTRDFVHVEDVVRATLHAARRASPGATYNIGTGSETCVLELAEAIQRRTGAAVDIEHVAARAGDIRHSRADIGRARAELGFEPRYDLESGLDATLRRVTGITSD